VGDGLEIYGKYGGRECRVRQGAWSAARCERGGGRGGCVRENVCERMCATEGGVSEV
jgi:hypothetical protein